MVQFCSRIKCEVSMESYGVTGGQLRKGLAWKDSLAVSPEAGGGGRRGESTEDHHRGGT